MNVRCDEKYKKKKNKWTQDVGDDNDDEEEMHYRCKYILFNLYVLAIN